MITLSILVIVFSLFVSGCGKQDASDSNEKPTIVIGQDPYTMTLVPVNIIKNIAEELGYPTEIVEGEVGFMYLGLAQGDIDIYPDVWLPTLQKTYMEKYGDKVEIAGTLYPAPDVGWVVPTYVDIDTIAELKGRADEFDNRIVGLEPSAGMMMTSKKTIEAYELDDYELLEGSTPAMMAEVEKATKNQEPIVFLGWRPHTMFFNYDIKLLQDSKGIWAPDDCITGVNKDFKQKAPDVYRFLQNFTIALDDVEEILVEMDETEKDADQLAKEWIEQNRNSVDEMLGK